MRVTPIRLILTHPILTRPILTRPILTRPMRTRPTLMRRILMRRILTRPIPMEPIQVRLGMLGKELCFRQMPLEQQAVKLPWSLAVILTQAIHREPCRPRHRVMVHRELQTTLWVYPPMPQTIGAERRYRFLREATSLGTDRDISFSTFSSWPLRLAVEPC